MAAQDEDGPGLAARLAIGAIAGFVATMAMSSAMRRLHRQLPGKPAALASSEKAPELRLALSFAYGAACGAALAALDSRPGRATGVLAGGGLWLATQSGLLPGFAALPLAEGETPKARFTALGGHLAWGWSVAEVMRELTGLRDQLSANAGSPQTAANQS